ncbi:hypothetical protein ACLOJK_025328 [Asimina triloba]
MSSDLPKPHLWYSTKEVIHALQLFLEAGDYLAGSLTYSIERFTMFNGPYVANNVANSSRLTHALQDHMTDLSIEEGSCKETATWAVKDAQIRNWILGADNTSAVWPWVVTNGIRDNPQQSKNGSVSSEDAEAQEGWIVISHITRVRGRFLVYICGLCGNLLRRLLWGLYGQPQRGKTLRTVMVQSGQYFSSVAMGHRVTGQQIAKGSKVRYKFSAHQLVVSFLDMPDPALSPLEPIVETLKGIVVLFVFVDDISKKQNRVSNSSTESEYRAIYDLVDLTRQVLSKYANQVYLDALNSFQQKKVNALASHSQKFIELIEDIDTLLASDDNFLLGTWLQSAKKLATSETEMRQNQNIVCGKACVTVYFISPGEIPDVFYIPPAISSEDLLKICIERLASDSTLLISCLFQTGCSRVGSGGVGSGDCLVVVLPKMTLSRAVSDMRRNRNFFRVRSLVRSFQEREMKARIIVFPLKGRSWCFSKSCLPALPTSDSILPPPTLKDLWTKISADRRSVPENAEVVVDFISDKMNRAWSNLQKAPDGTFKNKIHSRTNEAFSFARHSPQRMRFAEMVYDIPAISVFGVPYVHLPSEIFLKSISKDITKVEVHYPESITSHVEKYILFTAVDGKRICYFNSNALEHHLGDVSIFCLFVPTRTYHAICEARLLHQGSIIHKRNFYGSLTLLPFTAALAVLPLPNIPFFWILFRTYSNWKAFKGSERLLLLVSDCSKAWTSLAAHEKGRVASIDDSNAVNYLPGPPWVMLPSEELQKLLSTQDVKECVSNCIVLDICKQYDLNDKEVLKYKDVL